MNKEDAQKWLDYQKGDVKPTRHKLKTVVYSDNAINQEVCFELDGFHVKFIPLERNHISKQQVGEYMPAFFCEVISESKVHRGGNLFDISESLDRIMPWLGFDYELSMAFQEWAEYEGAWIECVAAAGNISMLSSHSEIPKKNIHVILKACEEISRRTDNRAKKAIHIRKKLQEAIRLEKISKRYSYLSYYNVIEIISDDLSSTGTCPSGNKVAEEIAKFKLALKGSQKIKIYYLLKAIENNFEIDKCILLADTRNKLAHAEVKIEHERFELCKCLAFWAAENFVQYLEKI